MEIISTEELKELIDENEDKEKKDYVLIDVREPNETDNYGMIPSAEKIPLGDILQDKALELTSEEFEEKYGFEKPGKDDKVIFYCKSGSRSNMAAQVADSVGFDNIKNYEGSVKEWSEIDSKVEMYGN